MTSSARTRRIHDNIIISIKLHLLWAAIGSHEIDSNARHRHRSLSVYPLYKWLTVVMWLWLVGKPNRTWYTIGLSQTRTNKIKRLTLNACTAVISTYCRMNEWMVDLFSAVISPYYCQMPVSGKLKQIDLRPLLSQWLFVRTNSTKSILFTILDFRWCSIKNDCRSEK